MEKCGCLTIRFNNQVGIKYCPLHQAAPALLALLTEGIGVHGSDDLAADLERMSNWMVSPEFADKLRAKAQAIRAAIAEAKGESPRGSTSPGTPKRRTKR